ncbi:asparagine--tRNA ligase, partial [Enterococcus faecalis]
EETLDIQEAYVKHLNKSLLKNQQYPVDVLERDTALLEKYVSEPFKRITYDVAIELLQKDEANNDYDHIEWGDDFGSP